MPSRSYRQLLGCLLLVAVACKDTTVPASAVAADSTGLVVSSTVLAKVDPNLMRVEARRLDATTLAIEVGDALRRISTDDGATWTDTHEVPKLHATAILGGAFHHLRLAWPQKDQPNYALFHRPPGSATESVAFQLKADGTFAFYNPAMTALPDGLFAVFTIHRSRNDSQLHALRWNRDSGWSALGPIPGGAVHFVHPASLASDAQGNLYLAFLQDRGFDPTYEHNDELTDISLMIMRSQDAGASWKVAAQDLGKRAGPSGFSARPPLRLQLVNSPEGELTLFWQQRYESTSLLLSSTTQEQLMVSRSADGSTWSPPQRLEDADLKESKTLFQQLRRPTPENLRQMKEEVQRDSIIPHFTQSPNGRSMALFWRDGRMGSTQLFIRASRDGGKSWTRVTPVDPERSVHAWPNSALATDAGAFHLVWTAVEGTVYHSRATLTSGAER